jgi:hypothetical protein
VSVRRKVGGAPGVTPDESADAGLLEQLARGDFAARGILYDRYRYYVHRFVAHCTNHGDDVEVDAAAGPAEDLAYLEIVALLRAGKTKPAEAASLQYLSQFRNGFRRIEVLQILQERIGRP